MKTVITHLTFIASIVVLSVLAAPASARNDGNEDGASAYPRFRYERGLNTESRGAPDLLINRPFQQR